MISFHVALLLLPNLVYLMTMKKGRDYKKKIVKILIKTQIWQKFTLMIVLRMKQKIEHKISKLNEKIKKSYYILSYGTPESVGVFLGRQKN